MPEKLNVEGSLKAFDLVIDRLVELGEDVAADMLRQLRGLHEQLAETVDKVGEMYVRG